MPLDPKKIRHRRVQLGLSQAAAAASAGMPQSHWSRIESGNRNDPKLSTAEQIAYALQCKITMIIKH